jgi:hypothetical protein
MKELKLFESWTNKVVGKYVSEAKGEEGPFTDEFRDRLIQYVINKGIDSSKAESMVDDLDFGWNEDDPAQVKEIQKILDDDLNGTYTDDSDGMSLTDYVKSKPDVFYTQDDENYFYALESASAADLIEYGAADGKPLEVFSYGQGGLGCININSGTWKEVNIQWKRYEEPRIYSALSSEGFDGAEDYLEELENLAYLQGEYYDAIDNEDYDSSTDIGENIVYLSSNFESLGVIQSIEDISLLTSNDISPATVKTREQLIKHFNIEESHDLDRIKQLSR